MADRLLSRVPVKTDMFDEAGNITRPWILFFEAIAMPLTGFTGTTPVVAGELVLSVPGTLGIRSNAAPEVSLFTLSKPTAIVALVKQAPTGDDIILILNAGGVPIVTVTILAGATSGSAAITGTVDASAILTLDIVSVGTTFPGADLSALVRF